MANWYYEDSSGRWQGPFESLEIKKLASVGMIQKETRLSKGSSGPIAKAENVKGVFDGTKELTVIQSVSASMSSVRQGISGIVSGTISKTSVALSGAAKGMSNTFSGALSAITPSPGKSVEEIVGISIPEASIVGQPDKRMCSNLPSRFFGNSVYLFLHTKGLRIQPPKGQPILITKEQMITAQQKVETRIVGTEFGVLNVVGAVAGVAIGGIMCGTIGAVMGGLAGGSGTNSVSTSMKEYAVDISFFNEKNEMSRLFLRTSPEGTVDFSLKLCDFLGVERPKKKGGFLR